MTVVVKLGGSMLSEVSPAWWDDLVGLPGPLVIVHGWSKPLADWQERRGVTPVFRVNQNGHRSRITDESVIADIRSVATEVRRSLCDQLTRRGISVSAHEAAQARLIQAQVRAQRWWVDGELRAMDNLVGPIRAVNGAAISEYLAANQALVITPLAYAAEHSYVNVDADRAAAAIASAVGAVDLIMITDVPGVLVDGVPVPTITMSTVDGQVTGGMRKKVRAAGQALEAGVPRVLIGSGRPSDLLAGTQGTRVMP